MRLDQLAEALPEARVEGDPAVEIADLAYDTRQLAPGAAFFCVRGEKVDGHDLAPAAVDAGAVALIADHSLDLPVPHVLVADVRAAMAPLAARFWGDPSGELAVAGITGTNGKTTTAFLLRGILEDAGRRTGLLGTVMRVVGGAEEEVERTTPESIDLQRTFRRMLDGGDVACAMEVSSHALAYGRADGIHFQAKVFTNLTQDHLDFHADMEDYFLAKRMLFVREGGAASSPGTAVVNLDDDYGRRLAVEIGAAGGDLLTFSAAGEPSAGFRAEDVDFDATGARFLCAGPDGEARVEMALPGRFNVANALGAVATAHALGVPTADACGSLRSAARVPGRFEPVDEGQGFAVLVDYAHTPDSLENVLRAARDVTSGRLISVFGCGGDRDREKRPLMGRIGAELSDAAIVTSDNPRSEDPDAIIAEIVAGAGADRVEVEPDRRRAIAMALEAAGDADTVVIAGKGHEQGQEFEGGRKLPFDDREVAREELRRLGARSATPGTTA